MAAGDAAGQNLLNDIEPLGSSWSSFGNEQIAHVLLDEMTAVHGVLRNFEPRATERHPTASQCYSLRTMSRRACAQVKTKAGCGGFEPGRLPQSRLPGSAELTGGWTCRLWCVVTRRSWQSVAHRTLPAEHVDLVGSSDHLRAYTADRLHSST